MFRHLTRLTLAVGAVLAVACGGDSGTGPSDATISGTYSLQTYNGKTLPFTITDTSEGQPFTITYAAPFSVTLNADHSVRLISTGTFSIGEVVETSTDTSSGGLFIVSWAETFHVAVNAPSRSVLIVTRLPVTL